MFDAIARIDNRGTTARGPWQYLGALTVNNIAGAHEAFTVTYAGTFQLEELQYLAANYRQVLNSEGLYRLCQCELRRRHARAPMCCARSTTAARSPLFEAGLAYPVIRSRETNLTVTGLGFVDQRRQLHVRCSRSRATGCAASASRPTPTGPTASSASTRST